MKQYTPQEIMTLANELNNAICKRHTGKMEGLQSLSTSTLLNPNCLKYRKIEGSICSHCYAVAQLNRYAPQVKKLEKATALLSTDILPLEALPMITSLYFRFEAFGDLINAIQVVNYFNIANKNPLVNFALWTKNPHIIAEAMKVYGIEKPTNLNIIYSSIFLNDVNTAILKRYSFIDKVFTVYDKNTIENKNISVNCGALHCATCLKCYAKNDIKFISEKLK